MSFNKSLSSWKTACSIIQRLYLNFSRRTLACSTLLVLLVSFMYCALNCLNCFIPLFLIILRREECEMSSSLAILLGWIWVPGWSSCTQTKSATASSFSRVVVVHERPEPFWLSAGSHFTNLFIVCFTDVSSQHFSWLSFHILYGVKPFHDNVW